MLFRDRQIVSRGVRCPKCGASPGSQCRNWEGKSCGPHRERMDVVDPPPALPEKKRAETHVQGDLWGAAENDQAGPAS